MPSNERQPAEDSTRPPERPARPRRGRRLVGLIVLAAYVVLLSWLLRAHGRADGAAMSIWELQDADRLVAWFGGTLLAGLYQVMYFIPVGFLAALVVPRVPRRFPFHVGGLLLAGGIAVGLSAAASGWSWRAIDAAGLVLPMLGCVFGTWIGATWLRGRRARLWLLPKIGMLVALAAAGCGVLLWLAVEPSPLPFEAATVTSAEKRELVRLVRSKSPRSLGEGQTHTLRLSEHDVNVLLSWGLSLGSADRKAQVALCPQEALLAVSAAVTPGGTERYLNLQLTGDLGVDQGQLRLEVDRCRLGRLELPSWLIDLWCPKLAGLLSQDRRSKPFLDAIETMTLGPGWIEATYTEVDLPPGFREDLFGPEGAGAEVLASTRVQVENLLAFANGLPPGERPTFEGCFETAFALARERSVEADAITENRAAIFALGVLLGHRRVEEFLGEVLPYRGSSGRWALQRVTLRGRNDWTKHFCVSAAIALFSDAIVSDAAGLLKEELDADSGGSGFSFADLLADRAGTTFAVRATRDEAAARALQQRISTEFRVSDFFPPTTNLPEGISDAELQSRYDGVGGEAYLGLIEEIDRRIASCDAYR